MLKNSWISKNFNYNEKLYNILQGPNSDPPQENNSASPQPTPHQIKSMSLEQQFS